MIKLIDVIRGNDFELVVILAGLTGMRISEILGLRWSNVDLDHQLLCVSEQLPSTLPRNAKIVDQYAPLKSKQRNESRTLPITEDLLPFFEKQINNQRQIKNKLLAEGKDYYDNDLVICKPDGSPYTRNCISEWFTRLLRQHNLRSIRFHDLRHTAATHMYLLSKDPLAVSQILGHSASSLAVRGINQMTQHYITLDWEAKYAAMKPYHNLVLGCRELPSLEEKLSAVTGSDFRAKKISREKVGEKWAQNRDFDR